MTGTGRRFGNHLTSRKRVNDATREFYDREKHVAVRIMPGETGCRRVFVCSVTLRHGTCNVESRLTWIRRANVRCLGIASLYVELRQGTQASRHDL